MKSKILVVLLAVLFAACGSSKKTGGSQSGGVLNYGSPNVKQTLLNENTFVVDEVSDDPTYGYTQENPIMVGKAGGGGPLNERRFLNALMGPDGEPVVYSRKGSCCGFKTKNGLLDDSGLLDMYSVYHKGLEKEVILYINMYDSDVLKIPVGFRKKE